MSNAEADPSTAASGRAIKPLPKRRTVPSSANAGPPDIILISSKGFHFELHKRELSVSSELFSSMFDVCGAPGASGEDVYGLPTVTLQEPSHVLKLVLPFCYNIPAPRLDYNDDETLVDSLKCALKYGIRRAIEALESELCNKMWHDGNEEELWRLAVQFRLRKLLKSVTRGFVKKFNLQCTFSYAKLPGVSNKDVAKIHTKRLRMEHELHYLLRYGWRLDASRWRSCEDDHSGSTQHTATLLRWAEGLAHTGSLLLKADESGYIGDVDAMLDELTHLVEDLRSQRSKSQRTTWLCCLDYERELKSLKKQWTDITEKSDLAGSEDSDSDDEETGFCEIESEK